MTDSSEAQIRVRMIQLMLRRLTGAKYRDRFRYKRPLNERCADESTGSLSRAARQTCLDRRQARSITPAAKKVIYQPEARARDPVRFPRWRVGLICSSMRNFLAVVIYLCLLWEYCVWRIHGSRILPSSTTYSTCRGIGKAARRPAGGERTSTPHNKDSNRWWRKAPREGFCLIPVSGVIVTGLKTRGGRTNS